MKNKQLVSILDYNAIGEGMLNETLGFNQDVYEFVDIKTYTDEVIFNIAKDFIENHAEEAIDYIKWCFALMDNCNEKTYDIMFNIVYKYTKAENKNYYWNDYIEAFVPREFLNNALTALEKDTLQSYNYEVKDDLGEYISIIINNNEYKILNDNEKYIFRDKDKDIYCTKHVEELLDYIYKLVDRKSYNERLLNRYLKNYSFIGSDILEHELTDGNSKDVLYWVNKYSLSSKTIETIGKEFVESSSKEAERFGKYILGIKDEYPNISNFLKGIIKKNILKLEKDYYWNSKLSQVMPRQILLDLEKYLMSNDVSFIHKTDDGEYIEISLPNNSNIRIYGFNYNDIISESSDYCVNINGKELYLKESEILTYLIETENIFSKTDGHILETNLYINHDKNWLLQETRILNDSNQVIKPYRKILDISNLIPVDDKILEDNVWNSDWIKINYFTKKIDKF